MISPVLKTHAESHMERGLHNRGPGGRRRGSRNSPISGRCDPGPIYQLPTATGSGAFGQTEPPGRSPWTPPPPAPDSESESAAALSAPGRSRRVSPREACAREPETRRSRCCPTEPKSAISENPTTRRRGLLHVRSPSPGPKCWPRHAGERFAEDQATANLRALAARTSPQAEAPAAWPSPGKPQ
jgi:hypothetical protein